MTAFSSSVLERLVLLGLFVRLLSDDDSDSLAIALRLTCRFCELVCAPGGMSS